VTRTSPAEAGPDEVGTYVDDTPTLVAVADAAVDMTAAAYEARPIKRARASRAEMAERAEMLIELAYANGPCSVRHLYYAATVAKMPGITKTDAGYSKVQRLVLELRRSGAIPYDLVVDSTRWMRKPKSYDSMEAAIDETARLYRRNLWAISSWRVEVWAESDSISSTIYPITHKWDVPLMVTRGQSSETFTWNAAEQWAQQDGWPAVLYIGDHDPAGLDIEESLRSKLTAFYGDDIEWERIGVTWGQVEELDLPGTPPKLKHRKRDYPFHMAVEAEALPPRLLLDLLDDAIAMYVDIGQLERLKAVEADERKLLGGLVGMLS